jgi:hypothetical protein
MKRVASRAGVITLKTEPFITAAERTKILQHPEFVAELTETSFITEAKKS